MHDLDVAFGGTEIYMLVCDTYMLVCEALCGDTDVVMGVKQA